MNAANRTLLIMLAAAAAIAAFWMLAIAPKREQAAELDKQVKTAQSDVDEQKQAIADGEQARRGFPGDYQQLVLLGKAVPDGDESASLLVQLNTLASDAGIKFRQLTMSAEASATTATTTAPTDPAAPTATEAPGEATTTAVPATESAAATMPIGATVGTAGLGTLPYQLEFQGDFFQIANFLAGVDRLIETDTGHVVVDGRLVTIDGFALSQDPAGGFPSLQASLLVTTYVTPPDQGLTAGATPTAPAPAGTVDATTTSATTSTTTTTTSP